MILLFKLYGLFIAAVNAVRLFYAVRCIKVRSCGNMGCICRHMCFKYDARREMLQRRLEYLQEVIEARQEAPED